MRLVLMPLSSNGRTFGSQPKSRGSIPRRGTVR